MRKLSSLFSGIARQNAFRLMGIAAVLMLLVGGVSAAQGGSTVTVTTTDDTSDGTCDTHCSLREAISAANDDPDLTTIGFNIPGAGIQTIQPGVALPVVTEPVFIDGWTQPGYVDAPLIALDGVSAGLANGLYLNAGDSTVRGLIIIRFVGAGILIGGPGGNAVYGNYIGTDTVGATGLGNRDGIYVWQSADNIIGNSDTPDSLNVIGGNTDDGVNLEGIAATGNVIAGNYVGLLPSEEPIGNMGDGVKISGVSSNNIVGEEQAINIIGSNERNGVYIESGMIATGNAIRWNSIIGNTLNGIDLDGDGVTANDTGDGDSGPNQLQNYPVLDSAVVEDGTTTIEGTLNSAASTLYLIQFFASETCDSSEQGEGEIFTGETEATTSANGEVTFSMTSDAAAAGSFITATATDPAGNTSEFSTCVTAEIIERGG